MITVRVSIVGMGPRGLGILQRIAELSHELSWQAALEVHVIDPGESGQGTHSARQPSYLLTNTVASQVTMFADCRGPSLTEWAQAAGYRRFGGSHYLTGDGSGLAIGEHDYLPRNMLGKYLTWVFDQTVRELPSRIRVVHHRDRAIDIEAAGPEQLVVRLHGGFEIRSDFVFLATGHCERAPNDEDRLFGEFAREYARHNSHLIYCPNPYPTDGLASIAPGATVAVQGFGLTAYDVLAELTTGRGGRFERAGNSVRYRPSGREPKILLSSRQCLPFGARGVNQKGITGQHKARFFTREAVLRLREQAFRDRRDKQLDFEEDVLPLVLREMGYAYRAAQEQRPFPPEEYEFGPEDRSAIDSIIDPLRGRRFANLATYKDFIVDHLTTDLRQAEAGNTAGPVKAATDVIRDTRQSIREAVEFGGLTPDSHQTFVSKYVPLMNRIAFGPPRQRNMELLALMDADIVDLGGGPGCRIVPDRRAARFAIESDFALGAERRDADALVIARVDLFRPELDRSPLVRNLLARGLICPYSNGSFRPGGIAIDRDSHPIMATGAPLRNIWAVGYIVEGPRFYTYALPRARLRSQFLDEADASVREMYTQIHQKSGGEGGNHADPDRQPVPVS